MNINEIAKLAGVSRATVSRYLNNGYVSEEKKKIIRKVIEETGYQPSSQAQMLRTKKTKQIGVIIPKINSEKTEDELLVMPIKRIRRNRNQLINTGAIEHNNADRNEVISRIDMSGL